MMIKSATWVRRLIIKPHQRVFSMHIRLSQLQQTILKLGLCNRRSQGQPKNPWNVDVTRAEVLADYYGWPCSRKGRGLRFDRSEVGYDRYNAGQVAVSRSMQRMEHRRLVNMQGVWSGARLTKAGLALAKRLEETGMVN